MPEGKDGMAENHAGPGEAHDDADPVPHVRFIAVDGTAGAGRFSGGERAVLEALHRIIVELPAAIAEHIPSAMPVAAIKADHGRDGLSLAAQAGGLKGFFRHGGLKNRGERCYPGRGVRAWVSG